jgi:hypothetical protein
MPHFKCVPCRTRVHRQGPPPEPFGDVCPSCGAPLEPVSDLTEIVGFRSVTPEAAPERWLDDDGSFTPEAIAVALPHPLIER